MILWLIQFVLITGLARAKLHHASDFGSKPGQSHIRYKNNAPIQWPQLRWRLKTGNANLQQGRQRVESLAAAARASNDQPVLLPNQPAQSFQLHTLNGTLQYPSPELSGVPMIFHAFDNHSAFLECLWTSTNSLQSLVAGSPANAHFVFISTSDGALKDALWMKQQLDGRINVMENRRQGSPSLSTDAVTSLRSRLHYVVTSVYQLGNWIPTLLREWACQDHGCGLQQAVFQSPTSHERTDLSNLLGISSPDTIFPIVLKRLDARYDWLPSPASLGNKMFPVISSGDGCINDTNVTKKIAVVSAGGCTFSDKVDRMMQSQAVAVIVYADSGQPVQDMNCVGAECDNPAGIPATMVPYNQELVNGLNTGKLYVSFQETTTENFYFGIDNEGLLQEMGWLLYPSFKFFNWQTEWFNFKSSLLHNLSSDALVVPIINDTIMQGDKGIVAHVQLPDTEKMSAYNKLELDASLSCPGTRDESCPPWDHTVQLFLCCNVTSHLCGMELGRWITPFRRRIGRWVTDVSPLFPLFTSNNCTFTMKTVPWAKAWQPSLNLRYSVDTASALKPYSITPLFRGGTFNQSYNKNYKPYYFTVPSDAKKVFVYAVITGHGSDNNGCGEFCVTSHHFVVNGHPNNITFDNAGTPLGCALRTPTGVEPNEHGTWLYGRDGWCDGREVDPWVIDVTSQLTPTGQNKINYFGWFDGKDPNPSESPGNIIMYSYLMFYR